CVLKAGSIAARVYGQTEISERHRHRYEVNNALRDDLSKHGLIFSGLSPDERLVEMIELPGHPYFVACQFHPELKSRPDQAHPLFVGLVEAMVKEADMKGSANIIAAKPEKAEKADSGKPVNPAGKTTTNKA
ncbi:MAG TPA: hypothetical protein PLF23_11935, partial [Candidatus Obscuribacter sp.]|nr:hypothetical protein [Candidatus Obscuribacter sp.]